MAARATRAGGPRLRSSSERQKPSRRGQEEKSPAAALRPHPPGQNLCLRRAAPRLSRCREPCRTNRPGSEPTAFCRDRAAEPTCERVEADLHRGRYHPEDPIPSSVAESPTTLGATTSTPPSFPAFSVRPHVRGRSEGFKNRRPSRGGGKSSPRRAFYSSDSSNSAPRSEYFFGRLHQISHIHHGRTRSSRRWWRG